MHSYVTSKNVKWCHLIWPTLYIIINKVQTYGKQKIRIMVVILYFIGNGYLFLPVFVVINNAVQSR